MADFRQSISFVGASTGSANGAAITLSLTALSGGIASSASAGDLVIIAHHVGTTTAVADQDMTMATSGYTELADLWADDTTRTNLGVFWKIMGSTPDTSAQTFAAVGRGTAIAYVLRNVDQSTPIGVTTTTATAINSGISDPPAITPITRNTAVIAVCGGHSTVTTAMGAPSGYGSLSTVVNTSIQGTAYTHCNVSLKTWSGSGAENPGQVSGITSSTNFSWSAATLAIRPKKGV